MFRDTQLQPHQMPEQLQSLLVGRTVVKVVDGLTIEGEVSTQPVTCEHAQHPLI